jgi:hypothetical protein
MTRTYIKSLGSGKIRAIVSVDPSDLAALPNVRLYPGMPATALTRANPFGASGNAPVTRMSR